MKKLTTLFLALVLASTASFAATYQATDCFIIDTANPGLKKPSVCNLDRLVYGSNLGVVPSGSAGVSVVERGIGFLHQSVFTLTAASVTITDATTAGAHGGIQLYDFAGLHLTILGATSDLEITAGAGGTADNASVVCALGTVVTATANDALTSTEADFMASTAATLTSGVGACDGQSATAAIVQFDGTATAKDLFLNFAVPDAGQTDASNDTLSVTGTVTITWVENGDN